MLVVSAERWGGPRVSAMVFREPRVIDRLKMMSMDPTATGPARLEPEPLQPSLLAGLVASVEHLAGLDEDVIGKRRRGLVASMDGVYEYLQRLGYYLMSTLSQLNHVNVVGAEENRVPLVSFTVDSVGAKMSSGVSPTTGCAPSPTSRTGRWCGWARPTSAAR